MGSHECDNCESPSLTIRGHGAVNAAGIEVFKGGHGRPAAPLPSYGSPSPAYVSSTTPAYVSTTPSYVSTTPAYVSTTPAYVSTTPAYVSSTSSYENLKPYAPDYVDSPFYGDDEPGYNYPVPANPLILPTKPPGISLSHTADSGLIDAANGANYVEPSGISSTYRAEPVTPVTPAYGVSTTYAPLTPSAPTYGVSSTYSPVTPPAYVNTYQPAYVSTTSDAGYQQPLGDNGGYNYPVPSNPLVLPTRKPAYASTTRPPYSPTAPAYQPTTPAYQPVYSTYQPTYPSTTRAPAYPTTPKAPAYQYSTTKAPAYPSTTRAPAYPSTTKAPAYPSTTRAPTYPSSTAGYQQQSLGSNGGYNYPVPANPLELPTRQPSYAPEQDRSNFKAPAIEYGGFKPTGLGGSEPRRPKNYQRPGGNLRPSNLEFGFKPLPGGAEKPRKPFSAFSGSNESPSFFNSVVNTVSDFVATTVRPFVPAFTTPRPAPPPPQKEVASVITQGFSSATLSNGPNSIFGRPGGRPGARPSFGGRPAPGGRPASGGRPAPRPASRPRPNESFRNNGGNRFNGGNSGRPAPPAGAFTANRPPTFGRPPVPSGSGSGRPGFNGPAGRPGAGGRPGPAGRPGAGGRPGPAGRPGSGGRPAPAGRPGFGGGNGSPGFGGRPGRPGPPGPPPPRPSQDPRGGRGNSRFKGTKPSFGGARPNGITTVNRPNPKRPAVLNKFQGTDWNKFGPGGFRNFNDTIGPEICERPGLFRHPTDCDKFYECYWDKWVEKYTLHVFPCPIVLGYDTGITACNWPFDGPQCQHN